MRTFSIQSFGCRVNQAEGFEWAEELQAHGFSLERNCLRSDIVIINTCALTAGAERDVRKFLRRLAHLNPHGRLIVTGCGVNLMREELERNSQVEAVIPNEEKEVLLQRILRCDGWSGPAVKEEGSSVYFRSRALVKIQDGCSEACTFCIIPRVRGRRVSRPISDVLRRVSQLVAQGFREIVLAGIHLTSYGRDLNPPCSLQELLLEATRIEGLGRVRLSSLDPRMVADALIDFITADEKICPHFHLSLQHGSERVLRLMGRKSHPEEYRRILSRLRERSPESSLGADIIVGFPGEEEKDFNCLVDFIASSPLTYLHVFPYSPRPGTVAARWPQILPQVKKKRVRILRQLAANKNFSFRRSFVGRVLPGLVIRRRGAQDEVLTANYIKVMVPSSSRREGEEVQVLIREVRPEGTSGELVS